MSRFALSFVLVILGFVGLADCLVIGAQLYFSSGECNGFGSCAAVLNSSYASFYGISLWKIGALFYLSYLSLLIPSLLCKIRWGYLLCIVAITGGCLYSLYLIYLQAFQIKSWCTLCLISAGIQFLSLILLFILKKQFINQISEPDGEGGRYRIFTLIASGAIALILFSFLIYSDRYLSNKLSDFSEPQNNLLTELDGEKIYLNDIPEYMTMKHEFDQFIWGKAKKWYQSEVLAYAAEDQGYVDATAFTHARYEDKGGLIKVDSLEAKRRFDTLKNEYISKGVELPSDMEIFEEVKKKYHQKYIDFVYSLATDMEKEYGARFLLKPSSINIPLDSNLFPIKGSTEAAVKIVIISDFYCSHCRKMHKVLDELQKELGEEKVQVAYIHHIWDVLPEGMTEEQASIAARASYAAWKQGKFWEYADKLFENQNGINKHDELRAIFTEIGGDLEKFHTDMESEAAFQHLETHRKYQKMAHADRPPTLMVNGFFAKKSRSGIIHKIEELNLLNSTK